MTPERDLSLSDANFNKLREIIHKNTGITISDGRNSLLLSRLRSRLRELNEANFKSYIARVMSNKSEMQELINRITTNKTYFYRTPRIWEHFRDVAVQGFCVRQTMRPLRVWSAAASTGEEAHTAGIVLEDVRFGKANFDYKIVGTDISSRVLEHAKSGIYAAPAVAQFKKDNSSLFQAHLRGDDTSGYKVAPEVKARISFKLHNLQRRMVSNTEFDIVFLRNVLIYFSMEDQESILRNIHAAMAPDSLLYIGESESLSRLNTEFEIVEPMIYRPLSETKKRLS